LKSVKPWLKYRDFSIFQDDGRCHLGIFEIPNFQRSAASKCQNVSPCQIWWKSVKPLPGYGDFSIFQDGGRRCLGFLNFQNFNGHNVQEVQPASPRQIFVEIRQTTAKIWRFFDFPRRRLTASSIFKIPNFQRSAASKG